MRRSIRVMSRQPRLKQKKKIKAAQLLPPQRLLRSSVGKGKKSLVLAGKEGAELVSHEEGLSKTFVRRLQIELSSESSVAFNEQTLLQP